MHELGLCQSVLMTVERRAAGRRVTGVRVRIGMLHRVDPAAFQQAFLMVAEGTVAAGAALDTVVVPARVTCHSCGEEGDTTDPLPLCPKCGSAGVTLDGGDELILESLAVEGATPAPGRA